MLVDAYVLNGFLFYFLIMLTVLVMMIEVFTFFELLSDMVKNNISMAKMLDYLFNLAPKLIYDSTPMAVLVATLICFGILTKHNEVTAFKAGGVSVYRLTIPVLFAAFTISGLLFAFDYYYSRKQTGGRKRCVQRSKAGPFRPTCGPTGSGWQAMVLAFTTTDTSTRATRSCTSRTSTNSTQRRFMSCIRFRPSARDGSRRCRRGFSRTG